MYLVHPDPGGTRSVNPGNTPAMRPSSGSTVTTDLVSSQWYLGALSEQVEALKILLLLKLFLSLQVRCPIESLAEFCILHGTIQQENKSLNNPYKLFIVQKQASFFFLILHYIYIIICTIDINRRGRTSRTR